MDHIAILTVAGVFLCFGLVSGKLRGSILTGPIITVALSIVLHGTTAGPAARWYGTHTRAMGTCEENRSVAEEPFAKG